MKFLITNDDGWGYDGIERLEAIAKTLGEVWVVAPANPMSGISHQITFERPMEFVERAPNSYALDGTPADCVRVAMTQLGVDFDWVLSGINRGANLGSDINVSGTVAAVREASHFNCRGIAISQHLLKFKDPFDWSRSERLGARVIPQLLESDLPSGGWFNVNLPDVGDKVDGVEVVKTTSDRNPLPAEYRRLEDGSLLYCAVYNQRKRTPGLDSDVCFSGSVSITQH